MRNRHLFFADKKHTGHIALAIAFGKIKLTSFKLLLFCLLFLGVKFCARAQTLPDYGTLYTQNEIPSIYLQINPDTLAWILAEENEQSNIEFSCHFTFESSQTTMVREQVGLRLRGNTSRDKVKKSFKISLNRFVQGDQIEGIEKINLNAEANDPSMLRSRTCWQMIRNAGLPGARTNQVRLYINDEYRGLYLNTEHFDEEFVATYFGNKDGNLFKCLYPADLAWYGNDPETYKQEFFGRRPYDLKTNTEADDYTSFRDLMDAINNGSSADFDCIDAVFNMNNYLQYLAIDVLTGNWDGYAVNKNNFYLYDNPASGLWEYLPYDLDNTLGIDWVGGDWENRNIYEWHNEWEERPLASRVMQSEKWRKRFGYFLNKMLADFNANGIGSQVNTWHSDATGAALDDTYRTQDFGFDTDAYFASLSSGTGGHVEHGILEFINIRGASALSQLEKGIDIAFATRTIDNAPLNEDDLVLRVFIEGEPDQVRALLNYADSSEEIVMLAESEPGIFESAITPETDAEFGNYTIEVIKNGIATSNCAQRFYLTPSLKDIRINEVQASNTATLADNAGEFDDWIEIHNAGESPYNLASFYLTDDPSMPRKWQFPDLTINAGAYLLLWADKDLEQGPLHMSFKVSNQSGETMLLSEEIQGGLRFVDEQFAQVLSATDLSMAIPPENIGFEPELTETCAPTPGSENIILVDCVSVIESVETTIFAFPNPSRSGIFSFDFPQSGVVFDATGKTILSFDNERLINLSTFQRGVYYCKLDHKILRVVYL